MKKILLLILVFVASLGVVSGATFFTTYQLNFPNEQPSSLFVDGGECTTKSCSNVNKNIMYYNTNLVNSCNTKFSTNVKAFNSCIIPCK